MANYYLDTEFLEGTQSKYYIKGIPLGTTKPTIDLISIGMKCSDGREFYELHKDCNLDEAWYRYQLETKWLDNGVGTQQKVYWIRENVLRKIYEEYIPTALERREVKFTLKTMKQIFKTNGLTREQLAIDIRNFIYAENYEYGGQVLLGKFISNKEPNPKFYAYFADYDWVVFCWIFGKMNELPDHFPYYCNDLKQLFDERIREKLSLHCYLTVDNHRKQFDAEKINNGDISEVIEWVQDLDLYPVQDKGEHSALEDAKWDERFHKFIKDNL